MEIFELIAFQVLSTILVLILIFLHWSLSSFSVRLQLLSKTNLRFLNFSRHGNSVSLSLRKASHDIEKRVV